MNKKSAVQQFVNQEFNNIPLSLVEKAYSELFEKIVPLVEPSYEDFELEDEYEPTEPQEEDYMDENNNLDRESYETAKEEFEENYKKWQKYDQARDEWESESNDYYPMWGTIFEASSSWLSEKIVENAKDIQDLGFIILDGFDELNACLGVCGCGYDFYEAHWIPLYDYLGMKWHNEDEE